MLGLVPVSRKRKVFCYALALAITFAKTVINFQDSLTISNLALILAADLVMLGSLAWFIIWANDKLANK